MDKCGASYFRWCMDLDSITSFDLKDICITEFDEIYGKYHSCNTPLSASPRIATAGMSSGCFELFWRASSLETLQEGRLPADMVAWHLPHPDIPSLRHYSWHPEGDKHCMISLPSSELTWHMVRSPAMAMVVTLEQLSGLLSDSDLDWLFCDAKGLKRRDLDGAVLFNVANSLYQLMQSCLARKDKFDVAEFNYCMGQVVLEWMELMMSTEVVKTRASNRERILTRALDYIRHNYHLDIKIRDLVEYAHSTSRNLQLVFKSQFGLTPLQFLRSYRLIKFHKGLRRYGSVTEAAVGSGLRHMGRLPDQYRSMFGENPGDYLGRIRGGQVNFDDGCRCGHCATES